ncbi:MAG: 6-phosphogluconolactonase [Acidimicrobiales bacterium]
MTPPPAGTERLVPVDDVPTAFAELVAEAFAARGGRRFTLVLSGGPTARACYERTAALAPGRVDWALVDVYLGDERLVPADDADANQRLVRESLIGPVGGVGSFHPMPTGDEADRCAAAYEETVAALLGGPGIDLIHLGLGPDGHTASLFPGSVALERPGDRLVMANTDPHERNPHRRLTLTLRAIDQARTAVFTVAGASKSQALRRVLDGEDLPAARVRAKTVRWVVDPAAMGLDRQQTGAGRGGGRPGGGERRR